MNDDELYELAKERIANDNGKRYSQEEIMEEFGIDEDDNFYEEKPLIDDFVEFLKTWDDFKKAYDKLLERVKEIEPSTYDLQVYNAIYTNSGKGRTDDCLYENINDEYDLCYSIKFKQTYVIWLSKEEREERKNA